MNSGGWRLVHGMHGLRRSAAALATCLLSLAGCASWRPGSWELLTPPAISGQVGDGELGPAQDSALDTAPAPLGESPPPPRPAQLGVVLSVLHVQIPCTHRAATEVLWNHLREGVLDGRTALRLRRNGLRAGVGNERWWEAVKATIDAIPGARSLNLAPVNLPVGYPLALELDDHAREQTLFYVGDDGVLSGETWPASRNVLRVTYEPDLANVQRAQLAIVPEVRQRREGWRWVRLAAGLAQEPNYDGRAFGAASFTVSLSPGEFLLIAPGREADAYGIVGGALLAGELDGQRFDSYVFLRADQKYVARGQ